MAYFRKRSGSWEASIEKKGYSRISRTFDTKTQAEAWAKVTEAEMVRGAFVSRKESENTTLSDALERYKKEITEKKKGSIRIDPLFRTLLSISRFGTGKSTYKGLGDRV